MFTLAVLIIATQATEVHPIHTEPFRDVSAWYCKAPRASLVGGAVMVCDRAKGAK
jgi:hypothetical protein